MNVKVGTIIDEPDKVDCSKTLDEILSEQLENVSRSINERGDLVGTLIRYSATGCDIENKSYVELINIARGIKKGIVEPYNVYRDGTIGEPKAINHLIDYQNTRRTYENSVKYLVRLFHINLDAIKKISLVHYRENDESLYTMFYYMNTAFIEVVLNSKDFIGKHVKDNTEYHEKAYSAFREIGKMMKKVDTDISSLFFNYAGKFALDISRKKKDKDERILWLKRANDNRMNRAIFLERSSRFEAAGMLYSYIAKSMIHISEEETDARAKESYHQKSIDIRKKGVNCLEQSNNIEELAINYSFIGKTLVYLSREYRKQVYDIEQDGKEGDIKALKRGILDIEKEILFYRIKAAKNYEKIGNVEETAINYSSAMDSCLNCYYNMDNSDSFYDIASYLAKASVFNQKSFLILDTAGKVDEIRMNLIGQDRIDYLIESLPDFLKGTYKMIYEDLSKEHSLPPIF